jgi:4-aminobutyrate aminotransferase-like enzyme
MGKPMGNGYPVAAAVMLPEIVEKFGRDNRYFNTFGGNTVAMAAAQAVLNVIRDEKLVENSLRVGKILREGFQTMAKKYEQFGDVRGSGLYVGVEMVKDRTTKEPDAAAAAAVVNGLRARRVLISATGPNANVLKVRPPLVFTEANADRLLTETEAVMATL